jgi:Alpha/beta hydrolase domain
MIRNLTSRRLWALPNRSTVSAWPRAITWIIGALIIAWGAATQAQTVPPFPTVEGPITGPGPMFPGIRPGPEGTNLEDFDYIVEEFFISGIANGNPYKTRIVVRRPPKVKKFSGIVVAEPMHRGGNALICQFARFGIGKRHHICLEIVARPINLNNNDNPDQSLQPFNAARYGDFSILSNQTDEIIAQVGKLIKSNLPGGPLFPYRVENIVLTGTSDSSAATRAYMSTAHADFRMPDGGPIYDGFFVSSTLGGMPVQITDVPTIQMPTQSEVHGTDAYRRPDSDVPGNQFRIYEVAGMSHNDARENPAFPNCDNPALSQFPYGAMTFMGLQHVIDWAADGTVPPYADYMEVDNDLSDGTRVALDEFGNAKGGVRTTYLDVPIYTYTIPNSGPGLCSQTGYQTSLPDDVLRSLYKNHRQYTSKVKERLTELIREGWFPKEYAHDYVRADAKEANIPNASRGKGKQK